MTFVYPAHIDPDPESGTYMVDFVDIRIARTFGDTWEEALAEAADCLEATIASMIQHDEPVPEPSPCQDSLVPVALPIRTALKLMLHRTGLGPTALARAMGCQIREAQRLLDVAHPSKADRLAEAVRAAGGPEVALTTTPRDDLTLVTVAGYGATTKAHADWMVLKGFADPEGGYTLTPTGERVLLGKPAPEPAPEPEPEPSGPGM